MARWLAVVVVLVPQLGFADPARDPWAGAAPGARTVEPSVVPAPDGNRLPGATTGTGIIIAPPANFADARDYPNGMVIRPPKIDQGILIEPSSVQGSLRTFGRGFQDAMGAIGKMFQQH